MTAYDRRMTMRVPESPGVEKDRAESAASAVRGVLAVSADIRDLGIRLASRMDAMERRWKAAIRRALWIQAGAIAAVAAAMRVFG